jgi:hypothetical protein
MLAQICKVVVLLIAGVTSVNGADRVEELILVKAVSIVCYLPGLQVPHQLQFFLGQQICGLDYLCLVGNRFGAEELLRRVTGEPCALREALVLVILIQSHVVADTWVQHEACLPFPSLAQLQPFNYPFLKANLLRI